MHYHIYRIILYYIISYYIISLFIDAPHSTATTKRHERCKHISITAMLIIFFCNIITMAEIIFFCIQIIFHYVLIVFY